MNQTQGLIYVVFDLQGCLVEYSQILPDKEWFTDQYVVVRVAPELPFYNQMVKPVSQRTIFDPRKE